MVKGYFSYFKFNFPFYFCQLISFCIQDLDILCIKTQPKISPWRTKDVALPVPTNSLHGRVRALEINEISTKDHFYGLRSEWNNLLKGSRDDAIFLTWEKMAPVVKYLEPNKSVKILCATNGNKILGIAPLKKSCRTFNGHFSYTVIEPLAYGKTDYTGIIFTEQKTECLRLFLTYLFNQKDWDFIYFYDVPETSTLLDLLRKNNSRFSNFTIKEGVICPYLSLPSSMEELLNGLSYNFRKNLKRLMRKLKREQGRVEFKEYYELGSLEETIQVLFDLHQQRWEARGYPGAFNTQISRDLYLDSARLFEEKGWFGLYFLTADDKPIAATSTLVYHQKTYGNIIGFNPKYSAYGVGNLIIMKILERCVEKKIKEFDFSQGDQSYKFKWTRKYRRNFTVKFVNNKPTSKLIRLGIYALERMKMKSQLGKLLQT